MDKQSFINKAKAAFQTYTPSDEVKSHLKKLDLIAVVGPTGAGKTTIIDRSGLPFVLSDMTRSARANERDGVDVNFRTDYDTLSKEIEQGDFVQYLVGHTGEFYGTKISSYPDSGPCAIPIIASAIPMFRGLGFRSVTPIYIVPPSYSEWMRRTGMHHDKDVAQRMVEAKESLGLALSDSSFYFVVNDRIEDAVSRFKAISDGTLPEKEESEWARKAAVELLAHLQLI